MVHGTTVPTGRWWKGMTPGWAGWAKNGPKRPSRTERFQGKGARATRRNGLQKLILDLNQGFEFKNQGFKYF
jgi:hypothetical protein